MRIYAAVAALALGVGVLLGGFGLNPGSLAGKVLAEVGLQQQADIQLTVSESFTMSEGHQAEPPAGLSIGDAPCGHLRTEQLMACSRPCEYSPRRVLQPERRHTVALPESILLGDTFQYSDVVRLAGPAGIALSEVVAMTDAVHLQVLDSDSCEGDVNNDGQVDAEDLMLVGVALGSASPDAADLNSDGEADIRDLVTVGINFGCVAGPP